MKTKQQKSEELGKLRTQLPKAGITIFTTFAREGQPGLSVAQMQELKRLLRDVRSSYVTAKKTLLEIVLKSMNKDIDIYSMPGSIGLVMGPGNAGEDEANAIAKRLYDFGKKNQALEFFGALLGGAFVDKNGVIAMATLPSREVILARLFGMIKYPLTALAVTLSQIAKQREQTISS